MKKLKEKVKNNYKLRYGLMVFVVLSLLGLMGYTNLTQDVTGKFLKMSAEDIEAIITYLLKILEIALGYLVGRAFRFAFKT